MRSSVRKVGECPNCSAMLLVFDAAQERIDALKSQIEQFKRNLESEKAKAANARARIQSRRLTKPLKGHSAKNAVQADMISKAIDRAIGVNA